MKTAESPNFTFNTVECLTCTNSFDPEKEGWRITRVDAWPNKDGYISLSWTCPVCSNFNVNRHPFKHSLKREKERQEAQSRLIGTVGIAIFLMVLVAIFLLWATP